MPSAISTQQGAHAASCPTAPRIPAGRLWGQPHEIQRDEIPAYQPPAFDLAGLHHDVDLRLMQTPRSRALVYPMASRTVAIAAARGIGRIFAARAGSNVVYTQAGVDASGHPALYVARGPNYTR